MLAIEETNAEIKDIDTKIAHARQAVMLAKEGNVRTVKIKPEWAVALLFFILTADMMRMMFSRDTSMSLAALIALGLTVAAYFVYLMTIYVPNARERRSNDRVFAERNAILEALLAKRKDIFEKFASLNGGKAFRSVSREKDLALFREGDFLITACLVNGLQTETFEISSVRYISSDSMLQEYNRKISGYTIKAHNSPALAAYNSRVNYSYIFFDNGERIIFVDEAYEFLKKLMPDKELMAILNSDSSNTGESSSTDKGDNSDE